MRVGSSPALAHTLKSCIFLVRKELVVILFTACLISITLGMICVVQDLTGLASLIKTQLAKERFLVIFDDVWDGTIFRRGCLDIVPDQHAGLRLRLFCAILLVSSN